MHSRIFVAGFVVVCVVCPSAGVADPCSRSEPRRVRSLYRNPETYARFAAGGMHLTSGEGWGGAYAGLEVGASPHRNLDLGLGLDYFHRSESQTEVLYETRGGYVPPVRAEVTRFESRTHLVPIGLTARLRLPTPANVVQPFVAAMLTYEILHLELQDPDRPAEPFGLGAAETFTGFGVQAAAGVEFRVTPGVGISGEVGAHSSSPSQGVRDREPPMRLRVDLDGAFARLGIRLVR